MFKPFFRRKQNTLESKEELNGDTNNIPKARENADDLVVISIRLHLIGLKSGASFLDQSLSEVKQNQFNLRFIYEAQLTIFSAVFWEKRYQRYLTFPQEQVLCKIIIKQLQLVQKFTIITGSPFRFNYIVPILDYFWNRKNLYSIFSPHILILW